MLALVAVSATAISAFIVAMFWFNGKVKSTVRCPDCGQRMFKCVRREPVVASSTSSERFIERIVYSCPDEHVQWIEVATKPSASLN